MNPNEQAKKQFESVIKADLNRWWAESDLDAEDLSRVAVKAIEDWLDGEIIGFELRRWASNQLIFDPFAIFINDLLFYGAIFVVKNTKSILLTSLIISY